MATVTVEINGRPYAVGCADGQEERVRILARQFGEKVDQVAGQVGQIGDLRLFLMSALMLADELHEARMQLQASPARAPAPPPVVASPPAEGVAEALNAVAARIEKIVQTI